MYYVQCCVSVIDITPLVSETRPSSIASLGGKPRIHTALTLFSLFPHTQEIILISVKKVVVRKAEKDLVKFLVLSTNAEKVLLFRLHLREVFQNP